MIQFGEVIRIYEVTQKTRQHLQSIITVCIKRIMFKTDYEGENAIQKWT